MHEDSRNNELLHIYEKSIVRPLDVYEVQDGAALLMPYSELGTLVDVLKILKTYQFSVKEKEIITAYLALEVPRELLIDSFSFSFTLSIKFVDVASRPRSSQCGGVAL